MTLEQRAITILERVARWIEDLPKSDWEQPKKSREGDAIIQSIIDQFKEEIIQERHRCVAVVESFKSDESRMVAGVLAHMIAKAIRG